MLSRAQGYIYICLRFTRPAAAESEVNMKLLEYRDLRERGIRYSRPHLWRLWNAGQFPKPIKVSASRNAWLESEIDGWIEQRIAERDQVVA
jgi:prophage regulatory protein